MCETTISPQQLQARWQNAISRAIEIDGERGAIYLGDGRFLIVSASDPLRGAYHLRLMVVEGSPVVTCTCKAAEHGFPCWHRATVLLMAGFVLAPDHTPGVDESAAVDVSAPTLSDVLTGRYFAALKGAA